MTEKKNIFKIAGDLIYSILGLVAMNGVLQLFFYPTVSRKLSDEMNDNVLVLLAVVSILATMFGTAANYARMVAKTHNRSNNGDFNVFLLACFPVAIAVTCVSVRLVLGEWNVPVCVLSSLLSILSILRYYGDVEFRLNVNYKRFSLYYVLIAIGYAIGAFFVSRSIFGDNLAWVIAISLGELFAIIYVLVRGSIFSGKGMLTKTENFGANVKTAMFLVGTNLINAFVLKSDSILIKAFVPDSGAVRTFYVATLIGKIIALLTTPLNGVIIGYLTRYKGKFTRRFFGGAICIALGVGVVFTALCVPVSHIFVKLLYEAPVYEAAKDYFLVANAGQVLYFVSGSMMIVVLRFIHERWQLIINVGYAALYAAVVTPLLVNFGLWGITWGLLIVNAIRFIAVAALGFIYLDLERKKKRNEKEN